MASAVGAVLSRVLDGLLRPSARTKKEKELLTLEFLEFTQQRGAEANKDDPGVHSAAHLVCTSCAELFK